MNTIHIAFALIAVLVVGMAVLALRVRELTRDLTNKGEVSPLAIEMAIKHEATMRKILAERLGDSIKDIRKKVDEALSRLGIDPETGMAYVGQNPIDVRSPRTKAQLAIERGDVAGAIDELVSVLPQGVSDRFHGWTILSGPDAQPEGEYPNTAHADHVHYDHSDSAAEVAKLLNITKPGRHAIVIDVPAARHSVADMVVDAVLNDIKRNGPIAQAVKQTTT